MDKAAEAAAREIELMQDKVFGNYDLYSRGYGDTWMMVVCDIMKEIVLSGLAEKIDDEVLDILEDDNFHTARAAADEIMKLRPYAMYQYANR